MQQQFPTWVSQPGSCLFTFNILGAQVLSTPSMAGLDGRGMFLALISSAANVVTITWNSAFGDIPYVFFQPAAGQNNTLVEIVSNTPSQLVFQTVNSDASTTPVVNANLQVFVVGYNTTSFVG